MATAAVRTETRTVTTKTVTLTIDEDEAKTLLAVLARVGGNPDNSPRKFAGQVFEVLRDQMGLRWTSDLAESDLLEGSLSFSKYDA